MKLKYFAHSAFLITAGNGEKILIDPFLDDNPNSSVKSSEVDAEYIILTHAHGDHLGDSFKIAKRTNSLFICVNELANFCASKGFNAHNMHIGGAHDFDFGNVKFTIAHHGSSTPDKGYAGEPAGVIITIDGKKIYHMGDTGLFYDMKLIGEYEKINYLLLPIGGNFTMGIDDAVKAVEFVKPETAIPIHYNTWPVIAADPEEFRKKVLEKGFNARVLKFGEEIEI